MFLSAVLFSKASRKLYLERLLKEAVQHHYHQVQTVFMVDVRLLKNLIVQHFTFVFCNQVMTESVVTGEGTIFSYTTLGSPDRSRHLDVVIELAYRIYLFI